MLKSPLTVLTCLPDRITTRLEAALSGLGRVIAAGDSADLMRCADRELPDVIVMSPKYVLGSDNTRFQDATVPGRLLVPLVAWWEPDSLISPLLAVRHKSVAWLLGDMAGDEQFLRHAVLEASASVHQQIAIALEARIELLPAAVGRELRTALSQPGTATGKSAWASLEAVRSSTLRRQLHRVSLASLDRLARITRLATAFRYLRFHAMTTSAVAKVAGYASRRTMRDHVRHEFDCRTTELGTLSSGVFVSRAVHALFHEETELDLTGS